MSSSFPNPLTEKEEQHYVELLAKNDPNARKVLIERNLRLVAHIAKKYISPGAGQDDLISIGTIGLIKAVNTYSSGRASKRISREVSLSLPIGTDKDGNEISLNDILGTDSDEIVDLISLKIQVGKLYEAIDSCLSSREKKIIIARYGLDGSEPKPQREIAKQLGISRSYVSRIEKKSLEKLKIALESPAKSPE